MLFFTDFFNVDEKLLDTYGAFDISLINDLPLFVDPFLLFGSNKHEYQTLHQEMLKYLSFLKEKSQQGQATTAEIKSWYKFSEVKQNWLGYSVTGNGGSGLGDKFGKAMSANMQIVFDDLNQEIVTTSSHIEKVGLFQIGVGKDNISDFTCNLIKSYLLKYTETFAKLHLSSDQIKTINVNKVYFNYQFERWMPQTFTLPFINGDYVILTPVDLLTKDDTWINSHDLRGNFTSICSGIPNDQLRNEIHSYFRKQLPAPTFIGRGKNKRFKKPSQKEFALAIHETLQQFPDIIKYYIKNKEENKAGAKMNSLEKVQEIKDIFQENVIQLITQLHQQTGFYELPAQTSFDEAMTRLKFMKDVIENKDGYRLFYHKGRPLKRESDLQVIYRLTWYSSPFDVNREVNNGRGPVDYAVSKGTHDKTLVEFKLASNGKLKMNLENQVKVYEKANNTNSSIKVIMYFDNTEYLRVQNILSELNLENDKSIMLIDAGDNKLSASNVK